ncbi:hypothetical protein [Fusobacterium sp. IOR10]|uniref:hypothetical protein n=1 Tax=Fusobacterium sp. IOR10 TaxID=2665157 RepID=UPI0013D6F32D|nr:hypothetical protein [Fusobacterium sp. IOR10]
MKKIIMIFAVLASVSFGAEKVEYIILGMVGNEVKVERVADHQILFLKKSDVSQLGIAAAQGLGDSFVDALMPDKSAPVVGEEHPTVQPPMDVVDGTVTTAYGAK